MLFGVDGLSVGGGRLRLAAILDMSGQTQTATTAQSSLDSRGPCVCGAKVWLWAMWILFQ